MLVASGPIALGANPLPDCVVFSGSPVRSGLAAFPFRQPSTANSRRRWSRQAVGWAPGELCLPPGGSEGIPEASAFGRTPLRAALPHAACSELSFRLALALTLRSWPLPCFPLALPRPHSSLPITARHSLHLRFAGLCPRTSPSVFSDAAAGIAAIPIRLKFSVLFQAVRPEKVRRIHPFDTGKLRPKSESRKRNLWMFSTARRFRGGEVGVGC